MVKRVWQSSGRMLVHHPQIEEVKANGLNDLLCEASELSWSRGEFGMLKACHESQISFWSEDDAARNRTGKAH